MSQTKAVVLEKNNRTITVLTRDGAFQTLKYKGEAEIGEEILLPTQRRAPLWRISASIAAVFLLTFMGIFGWNAFQPRTAVAMISLDINPSLQLTVDQKGKVLELESLNSEAEQLTANLSLVGKPWIEVLNKIIQESVQKNYLNEEQNWVVVGYSAVESEKERTNKNLNTEEISKQVQQAVSKQGLKPTLAVYELTEEQKRQAQETGLSLGEYAIIDTAHKAGVEVKPETIKQKEELSRLLDTPEIQNQMRADKRIIETMSFFAEQDVKEKDKNNSQEKKNMGKDNRGNKFNDWYKEKLKEKQNQKKNSEQPQNLKQPLKDKENQESTDSKVKKNEAEKVKSLENYKDSKGKGRGNNDQENKKDNNKGKNDQWKGDRNSNNNSNQNKDDNKGNKAIERTYKNSYQEKWQGMDLRSVLRMSYSQHS